MSLTLTPEKKIKQDRSLMIAKSEITINASIKIKAIAKFNRRSRL